MKNIYKSEKNLFSKKNLRKLRLEISLNIFVTEIEIVLDCLIRKGMSFTILKKLDDIYLYNVNYYVTTRTFHRFFYNLEVMKIVITKKFKFFTLYK